jgi:hypothetical protein
MGLLEDLADHLIVGGHATEVAVDIFTDYLPDDPASLTCLTEYGGSGSVHGFTATTRRVQIISRSKTWTDARSRNWDIYKYLDDHDDRITTANSGRWMVIRPLQTPFRLRIDEAGRSVFAFNVSIVTPAD